MAPICDKNRKDKAKQGERNQKECVTTGLLVFFLRRPFVSSIGDATDEGAIATVTTERAPRREGGGPKLLSIREFILSGSSRAFYTRSIIFSGGKGQGEKIPLVRKDGKSSDKPPTA